MDDTEEDTETMVQWKIQRRIQRQRYNGGWGYRDKGIMEDGGYRDNGTMEDTENTGTMEDTEDTGTMEDMKDTEVCINVLFCICHCYCLRPGYPIFILKHRKICHTH